MSIQDRYATIRAINRILAGDYEMRLFQLACWPDTHCFYVKPAKPNRLTPKRLRGYFAWRMKDWIFREV